MPAFKRSTRHVDIEPAIHYSARMLRARDSHRDSHNTQAMHQKIRDAVTAELATDQRILAIYLLGSAASGRLRADSDIDIAIMTQPGIHISELDRAQIAAALSYRLGRQVDLGMLSSRNLVYANEVLHTGIQLYSRDPGAAALYAANLLGLYLEFNEGRQEILNAYTI
ncbi:Predicted nucleotidyltransferase [Alkalispirochaeta americana]|uniref:Predicted nucleotidyltransferase n=2 Tax=Alkalispirochaeta americana TaxID=159291 RepID=A0A1N6SJ99_9SPIO|nr:Predicted nucleotidyltransferase [Alkalispirochaeta americana]